MAQFQLLVGGFLLVLITRGSFHPSDEAAEACAPGLEEVDGLMLLQMPRTLSAEKVAVPSALCSELSDGRLDGLGGGEGPYSAEEVGQVACNMAANIFANGTIIASPSRGVEIIYAWPNGSAILQNDYYYMWQRDAGLTMRSLLRLPGKGQAMKAQLTAYAKLLQGLWAVPTTNKDCWPQVDGWCDILGEPKFFVNGSVYNHGWGRSQNDGPAINALVLIELLSDWEPDSALAEVAKNEVLRALNYVGNMVSGSTVDPWEMLYGQHFFVHAMQYRAMAAGVELARKQNWTDCGNFANWATMLTTLVETHWSPTEGIVRETVARPWHNTVCPKCASSSLEGASTIPPCELDVAVLCGSLYSQAAAGDGAEAYPSVVPPHDSRTLPTAMHLVESMAPTYEVGKLDGAVSSQASVRGAEAYPSVMPPHDSRILATAMHLVESMAPTYEVNQVDDAAGLPGVLIGRYPGDEYSGVIMTPGMPPICQGFNCGNPWFLTTHSLADVLYSSAKAAARGQLVADPLNSGFLLKAVALALPAAAREQISSVPSSRAEMAEMLIKSGDGVLARAKKHAGPGMHMSEQIYRGNNKMPPLEPGIMVGARDLTWSYASLLDALCTRREAVDALRAVTESDK